LPPAEPEAKRSMFRIIKEQTLRGRVMVSLGGVKF
jgi:hypothetical protein